MSKIYNFDTLAVWLDGVSLAGHINEVELPELEFDMREHESLALRGTSEYPTRMNALECTITWADYTPELARAAANPFKAVNLQMRANFAEYTAGSKTGDVLQVISLTGRFKNNQLGSYSPGEMERESVLAIDYVKEVWNGQVMLEFSVNPPIYRSGPGAPDLFALLRANLGL
ncbi:phage major tail tube protein [Pseudanabaena sp. FACHB-2040]|uniref:phage major tail tube protein n=1 Tax=Pseudanabaena sp. FACHB-2040 TaxID=2692859 RepID=UPI001682CDE0|nr:phage major tail tube protein [Pseudanabaena sp. FACHB-2040]MBD2261373.1 phage major tail tube protein [Pseudanabaena sp. FACHB-2040]